MDLERGSLSRRGFLQSSLTGLAAVGLPVWFAKELVADAEQQKGKKGQPVSPNDRIVMGHIGCGGRGRDNVSGAQRLGAQYVAFCDVSRSNRQDYAMRFNGAATLYEDYRELLARSDINAVSIATPDHWHAMIAIAAMRAGKDVYCEKPLTLTVDEGKAVVRVARQTNCCFQTGSQQRLEWNGRFRLAVELVRNGRIGKVETIECRIENNPLLGQSGPFRTTAAPDGLNWDAWVGPTPAGNYVAEKFTGGNFRWWYAYSGGKMTDWGAHHLDIAQWALNMDQSGPIEVTGTGEAPDPRPLCYTCHPHFTATYKYANGTTVRATSRGGSSAADRNGVHFAGEDGKWIFVNRDNNGLRASDPRLISEPLPANAVRLATVGNTNHMRNFLDCVKTRQQPICNAEVGHRSVTVCHIGNIAIRNGWTLHWDPVAERFTGENAEAANLWLDREKREPYRLEV